VEASITGYEARTCDGCPGYDQFCMHQRICFCLQVKRERLDEYKRRHQAVWPEMLHALRETGWHNYSLFLRPDGLLIGYFETPDFERARAGMAETEVNRRWQAEMREFFESGETLGPDEQMRPLQEVFHLD
jgi:L-rhamnose mutarotase